MEIPQARFDVWFSCTQRKPPLGVKRFSAHDSSAEDERFSSVGCGPNRVVLC